MVSFCVECANATQLETARGAGLSTWCRFWRGTSRRRTRAKLVQLLLRSLCPLGEPRRRTRGEDDIDEAREEELQVQTVAAGWWTFWRGRHPPHALPEVAVRLRLSPRAPRTATSSGGTRRRRWGSCEGCAEGLQRRAPEILPKVVESLRDPSPTLRGAAFTLGQMRSTCSSGTISRTCTGTCSLRSSRCSRRSPIEGSRSDDVRDGLVARATDDEAARTPNPAADIGHRADFDARPQVKEMLLSACASAAAAAGGHAPAPARAAAAVGAVPDGHGG